MHIETLSRDELREICGAVRHDKQCEALRKMGIPYLSRPDGSPVVDRAHVRKLLGGKPANDESPTMNLDALHG